MMSDGDVSVCNNSEESEDESEDNESISETLEEIDALLNQT